MLILLMPVAIIRRWPSVATASLRSSNLASIMLGSLAFGFIATVGLWAMTAGLSEPYPTLDAYIESTLSVPPGLVVVFAVTASFWAIVNALLMRFERRAPPLYRAALRLVAASPLQLLPWAVAWAPFRILAHVQSPSFGLVAGKPRWLVDSITITALGSMWIAAAGLSIASFLLMVGLLRFDRAQAGANCLWCQYPRKGLAPADRCPECGRPVAPKSPVEWGSTHANSGPAEPAGQPACPACLPAAGG